jgi:hypothetical protein
MTVWIYTDTSAVGDKDHLKVFATIEGRSIVARNDLEGAAFEYPV